MADANRGTWAWASITVRTRTLSIAAAVLGAAIELLWRTRYGLASPALGLVFVALCFAIGRLAERLVHGRAASGFTEGAASGVVILAFVYELTQAAHLRVVFLPLAVVLGALGVVFGGTRAYLRRRIRLVEVLVLFILLAGVAAFANGVDLLNLRLPAKTNFEWIATPSWFAQAYGVASGFPVPDPMVHGGLLETEFGASIFPALVRETTRLPLHVSYALVVVFFAYAKAPLALALVRRSFETTRRARRVLELAIPALVLCWTCEHIASFPGMVARTLYFVFALHAVRARSWRSAPALVVIGTLLAITHRPEYVAAVVTALTIAVVRAVARDRRSALVVVAATLPTSWFGTRIVHHYTATSFALFGDHFHAPWLGLEWSEQWHWFVVAVCALLLARAAWPTRRGLALVLATGAAIFAAGTGTFVLLLPTASPQMDAHSMEMARFEMMDYAAIGREGLVLACVLVALGWIADTLRVEALRIGALAGVALTGWYVHDHRWVLPQMWLEPSVFDPADAEARILERKQKSGELNPDPAIEVLARVPVEGALVMSDVLLFDGETPHWVAYFGHRFYLLRTGRWAPAQPRFAEMQRRQGIVFATASTDEAMTVLRGEGITHLIVAKDRPLKWAEGLLPVFENERFLLYVIP